MADAHAQDGADGVGDGELVEAAVGYYEVYSGTIALRLSSVSNSSDKLEKSREKKQQQCVNSSPLPMQFHNKQSNKNIKVWMIFQ